MSLPWIRIPTVMFADWWKIQRWTPEDPCPSVLIMAGWVAIQAQRIELDWPRSRMAFHCGVSEKVIRRLQKQTETVRDGIPWAGKGQASGKERADDGQEMGSTWADDGQASGKVNGSVEPKPGSARASNIPLVISAFETKKSSRGPRARVLKIESEILDADREVEREGDAGSEEKDLKKEDLNTGAEAPMTVADPWEKLSKDLKPVERPYLPAIQQFHQELVKKGMRAKSLDLKQCRAVIAALAMYPIEDLLLAVQGIQWDEYSKGKRRCLEVGWILNPERIAGWIELGVEGPPPGHPMSKRNLNGAVQDGIDTYRTIMFDLPAGVEHLASAATTMGTEGGAALGNRPVRDMRGIPPVRKL